MLIITLGVKANRMDKVVNAFVAREVIIMYRYNAAQFRAKVRAAQWRAKQEAKRKIRELERKFKQMLKH